jgi:hypothetical protein
LRTFERDLMDGITLRAVHNKVTGHLDRDEQVQSAIHDRLARIETHLKATDKQVDAATDAAAAAFHTGNTGRFEVPAGMRAQAGSNPVLPQQTVTPPQPMTPYRSAAEPWPGYPQPPPAYPQPPPGFQQYPQQPGYPGVVVQVGPQEKERDSWAPVVGFIKRAWPVATALAGGGGLIELLHRLFAK